MNLQLTELTTNQELISIRSDWLNLALAGSSQNFFLTPQFLLSWWEALGKGTPHVLAWYDGAELVGLAPLFQPVDSHDLAVIGCKDLSDYLNLLHKLGYEQQVVSNFLEWILQNDLDWSSLRLCSLPNNANILSEIKTLESQYEVTVTQQNITPIINLPASWEEYLQNLDRKQRHEVRRKWRRFTEQYSESKSFELIREYSEEAFVNFKELHQISTANKAEFWSDHITSFFQLMLQRVGEAGWLKLFFTKVEAERAATMLIFDFNNDYLLYNSGYNPDFRQLSVGQVLTSYTIKHGIENSKNNYNFLRGDEEYKFRLGGVGEPVWDVVVSKQ